MKRVCGRGPRIPDNLVKFCLDRKPRDYRDIQYLVKIFRRETGERPIGYAQVPSLYRIVTGRRLPVLSPDEIHFVVLVFREVDFQNHRMRNKKFAYNFLFRAILTFPHVQKKLGFARCVEIRDLIKPLSC